MSKQNKTKRLTFYSDLHKPARKWAWLPIFHWILSK